MATLFDVMLQVARNVEAYFEGAATADGTTTTLIDQLLADAGYGQDWANDQFNGGTLFYLYQSQGATYPMNTRLITDFDAATYKITVDAAWSFANPAHTVSKATDLYGVLSRRYPRQQVVNAINQALLEIGDVPTEDTSLTTASAQKEYTIPANMKATLREVWLARNTAAPWDWERVMGAKVRYEHTAATGILEFPYQPRVGYKIRLLYLAPHAMLRYSPTGNETLNTLSGFIQPEWLALEAAIKLVRWRLNQAGGDEGKLMPLLNDLLQRRNAQRREQALPVPPKQQIFPWTDVE